MPDDDKIYVRFRGRTLGPLTHQKVRDLIQRGQITRIHELSGDGLSWSKAEDFGEFFAKPVAASSREQGSGIAPDDDQDDDALLAEYQADDSSGAVTADPEPEVEWYAHLDGENRGPLSIGQLRDLKSQGRLHATTLVWRAGIDTWQPADQALPEFFGQSQNHSAGLHEYSYGGGQRSGSITGYTQLAIETDRRRGWAFFFGIVLIVVSSLQIIGQLATVFIAASGSAAGVNTVPALIGGMLGIALAGTILAAGILLLQYCSRARDFAANPSESTALAAQKQLSTLWCFVGIASLVWLVIAASLFLIVLAIGLSLFDAISQAAGLVTHLPILS